MSEPSDPLVILRFRDIEVPPGETIREHKLAIAAHGACWWGWLSRDYERNPHAELLALLASESLPKPIALHDTGRGLLYRATCEEVHAATRDVRTPDYDLTPLYYRHRKARAWFKLTSIETVDVSVVVGRECVALPSASEECGTELLGQQIVDIRQLRRQDVTMWVVQ